MPDQYNGYPNDMTFEGYCETIMLLYGFTDTDSILPQEDGIHGDIDNFINSIENGYQSYCWDKLIKSNEEELDRLSHQSYHLIFGSR